MQTWKLKVIKVRLKNRLWTKTMKTLTWISSQEAAVVVKMFVVADSSAINALSTSPNTSFQT